MDDIPTRIFENLINRTTGPMMFRVYLQPLMAIFFAVRSGLQDAKSGKPPFFYALFTDPGHRIEMLKDGWKSVGKVFVLALVLDVVYQIIVRQFVYPGEALITALILAIVPYLLLRGVVTRMARKP
jgi:hypothetical protein